MQAALSEKLAAVTKDRDFIKEVNYQLELNQAELQKKCKALEEISRSTLAERDEQLRDLREQASHTFQLPCTVVYGLYQVAQLHVTFQNRSPPESVCSSLPLSFLLGNSCPNRLCTGT
jgi:hypothetical protein